MYMHLIVCVTDNRTMQLPALPCACASLRRAARAVSQMYESELLEADLTITQFTLLQMLDRVENIRQRELGEYLVMDSTTLTRTLRPLVIRNLVQKSIGADRRERYWSLSNNGRRVLQQALPAWKRSQARLRRRLGKKNWEQLEQLSQTVALIQS